ncbi:unnamed protein product [Paramecium octaurelia]|uniref:Uncharacterized protein n=1 Tax=Paramecium octaurelia TaxID=43137 RepID=A0A8S1S3K4_PAROT|nr:unnamed protein product [Paramecium octaurelia]
MSQYFDSVRNLLQKSNCSIIRSFCRPYQFYLKIFFEKRIFVIWPQQICSKQDQCKTKQYPQVINEYCIKSITNHQQTQMIILEYSYIQILLPLIVEGEFWKRMPNYKEALKIFVSILHHLFIDAFQNLPLTQQDIVLDDNWVPLFDFSRNPKDGFYQLINCKHPKYSYNKDVVVLGLYNKVELHPIILHNGYKNIRDNFTQYCDYILSLIL